MSGSQDMRIIDQRTATKLSATIEQRRDPWPFVGIGILSTNYALLILGLRIRMFICKSVLNNKRCAH